MGSECVQHPRNTIGCHEFAGACHLLSLCPPRHCPGCPLDFWELALSIVRGTLYVISPHGFLATALQEMLDQQLKRRQARETGICPIREELYAQCFGGCTLCMVLCGSLCLHTRAHIHMSMDVCEYLSFDIQAITDPAFIFVNLCVCAFFFCGITWCLSYWCRRGNFCPTNPLSLFLSLQQMKSFDK